MRPANSIRYSTYIVCHIRHKSFFRSRSFRCSVSVELIRFFFVCARIRVRWIRYYNRSESYSNSSYFGWPNKNYLQYTVKNYVASRFASERKLRLRIITFVCRVCLQITSIRPKDQFYNTEQLDFCNLCFTLKMMPLASTIKFFTISVQLFERRDEISSQNQQKWWLMPYA